MRMLVMLVMWIVKNIKVQKLLDYDDFILSQSVYLFTFSGKNPATLNSNRKCQLGNNSNSKYSKLILIVGYVKSSVMNIEKIW